MATSGELMSAVAGFLHRPAAVFSVYGHDNLLRAINNARLQTERLIDFELSRISVDVPNVSMTAGGSLATAFLHGGDPILDVVNVKKVKRAFLAFTSGAGTFPISIVSRDKWLNSQQRRYERVLPTDRPDQLQLTTPFTLIQQGTTIMIVPGDGKLLGGDIITVYLDVYKFLPNYGTTVLTGTATSTSTNQLINSLATFIASGVRIGGVVTNTTTGASAVITAVNSAVALTLSANIFTSGQAYSINVANETDFLLTNCFDWLMYASVEELNCYLKEDERIKLDADLVKRSWEGVVRWNDNYIRQEVEDTDMD